VRPSARLELDHDPAARPRRWPSIFDLLRVGFFAFGFPRNAFGSIDITNRCNLRCQHCYYYAGNEEDLPAELTAEEWVTRLETLTRARGIFQFFNCTWVGGDPLLRKDVIARCKPFFRYNTIVTNGTIPLPDWPDVNWYISIDGDEDVHEEIRDSEKRLRRGKRPGIYRTIMDNVRRNRQQGITMAYCISRANAHCIERVVKDCYEAGAQHITFDFFTPIQGLQDDSLWLAFEERDQVIDKLLALRTVYGNFFVTPERVFKLMRSDRCRTVTDHCLLRDRSFALDASGNRKGKCVMGDDADCDRCGCVVPFYLRSLVDRPLILGDLAASAKGTSRRLLAALHL
jgi:MoaA/NifB/PqqE/SkfB family radical SAM enzyme